MRSLRFPAKAAPSHAVFKPAIPILKICFANRQGLNQVGPCQAQALGPARNAQEVLMGRKERGGRK